MKDKPVVCIVLRMLIGALFCLSAVAKLVSIDGFELYIYSFGWLSLSASFMAARLCIGVELVLALLLITGWYPRLTRLATLLLLIGFSVVLCIAALMGRSDSCQCFGDLVEMNPVQSLLKNAILIALVLLYRPHGNRPQKKAWKVVSAVLALLLLASPFAISVPDNWGFGPHEESFGKQALQESVSEGGPLARMGVGTERRLVAFVTPRCPYCKLAREKLTSLARRHKIGEESIVYVEPGDIGDSLFLAITYGARPLMMLMDGNEVRATYHLRNVDEKEVSNFLQ